MSQIPDSKALSYRLLASQVLKDIHADDSRTCEIGPSGREDRLCGTRAPLRAGRDRHGILGAGRLSLGSRRGPRGVCYRVPKTRRASRCRLRSALGC